MNDSLNEQRSSKLSALRDLKKQEDPPKDSQAPTEPSSTQPAPKEAESAPLSPQEEARIEYEAHPEPLSTYFEWDAFQDLTTIEEHLRSKGIRKVSNARMAKWAMNIVASNLPTESKTLKAWNILEARDKRKKPKKPSS